MTLRHPCQCAAAALLLYASVSLGEQLISPSDPAFEYSETVLLDVNPNRARFTRETVDFYANNFAPGARVNFATDATAIRIGLRYREQGGSGRLALEVDGALVTDDLGSDTAIGELWVTLFEQEQATEHSFSVVLPYGADVDFLGLTVSGGQEALLEDPAQRPPVRYVAYGDSITNGVFATTVAQSYPYLVGNDQNWQVINMGFSGQVVTPADGRAVGELGADVITVAIGTNDFWFVPGEITFKANYNAFLDQLRALQPDVPIYAITPIWAVYDGYDYFGTQLEDYRRYIRELVAERQRTDRRLRLLEGYDMVPPAGPYYPDGIHPSDVGFRFYAAAVGRRNLARNGGFEWDDGGAIWVDWGNTQIVDTRPASGASSLRVGPGQGGRGQAVGGLESGQCYALQARARQVDADGHAWLGVSFYNDAGTEIQKEQSLIPAGAYQSVSVPFVPPRDYDSATLWTWKEAGGYSQIDAVTLNESTGCTQSPIRGVGYHPLSVCEDLVALAPAWHYNWTPLEACTFAPEQGEFIPMIWDEWFLAPEQYEKYIAPLIDADYPALLGFNEPDLAEQADMTVAQALDLWPQLEATGLRLGSPAPTQGGTAWLESFLAGASERGHRVDFLALHWYGDCTDVEDLRAFLAYWDRKEMPMWLTEFSCYARGEAVNRDFLEAAIPVLESFPRLERYAWYASRTEAPVYGGADMIDEHGAITTVGEFFRTLPRYRTER
ncbi:MAG: glycosyl hydrolase [Pseudomonadota bacterium]